VGRPPREDLRPLRPQRRHQAVRRPRRAVHDRRALPLSPARVRDRRQRLRAPRQTLDRPPQGAWPNLIVVHTPVHASWLNQAEIYFSVVQRKVLTPNDFADLDALKQHLLAFGRRYEQIASPFQWKFTRQDLHKLLAKTDQPATLAA